MPIVTIDMLPGRTAEQKAKLARKVTENFLEICGGTPETVHVLIREVPTEHWAIGGRLLSIPQAD